MREARVEAQNGRTRRGPAGEDNATGACAGRVNDSVPCRPKLASSGSVENPEKRLMHAPRDCKRMIEDPLLVELREARERHTVALRRLNVLLNKTEPSADVLRSAIDDEREAREKVDLLVSALQQMESTR